MLRMIMGKGIKNEKMGLISFFSRPDNPSDRQIVFSMLFVKEHLINFLKDTGFGRSPQGADCLSACQTTISNFVKQGTGKG